MHRAPLRRLAPAAATLLGLAAFAVPAYGAGGVAGPTIQVSAHPAGVVATADVPVAAGDPVTVTRGGTQLAAGTFGTGGVAPVPGGGGAGVVELGVNAAHLAGATGCWTGFVPQILGGDVVNVAGKAINIPDMTAEAPVVEGNNVVVRGTAPGATPGTIDIQLWPANLGRFGAVGGGSKQFIDTFRPTGHTATLTFDAAGNYVARFGSLGSDLAMAAGSTARIEFNPALAAAVDPNPTILVDYDSTTPGPAAGCAEPYRPNEATGVSRAMISTPNLGTDLTVSGVGQPLAVATGVTLTDSAGRTISAPAIGGVTWTANVPAAQLAGLADGPIKIGSMFAFGAGGTVKGMLNKDTAAPNAPTVSVPAGTYSDSQLVSLRSAEGTIHYTLDGSDATANSKAYKGPINVADSATIKAVAVDAAGNVSDMASFAYTISRPQPAAPAPVFVAPVQAPKMKLDALTISGVARLKTVHKRGISMVVFAPEGAKVVRVRLMRGRKAIDQVIRKVSKDGVLTIVVPHSKKARRALRRGTYRVLVTPGASASQLGATTTRTVRIR